MSVSYKIIDNNSSFFLYFSIFLVLCFIFVLSLWIVPTVIWFSYFPVWLPWKTLLSGSIGLLLLVLSFILMGKVGRWFIIGCYLLYAFVASVYAVHIILYSMPISSISIAAVYQTNTLEIMDFLKSYVSWKIVVAVMACWIIPILFLRHLLSVERPLHGRKAGFAVCLLILTVVALTIGKTPQKMWKYNPVYQIYEAYSQFMDKINAVASLTPEAIEKVLKAYPVTVRRRGPVTLVVVMGESAARGHHGYYGYPRQTTPLMEARRKELLVFTDMISAAPNTVEAHTKSLLLPLEEKDAELPLMKLLNTIGMHTWWITTQYAYDATCSPLPFLADEVVGLNGSNDKIQYLDDIILPKLAEVLRRSDGRSQAIFLNIMGSHVMYKDRYPNQFAYFTNAEGMTSPWSELPDVQTIVNQYDNSILYTDFILEQIIRQLEKVPNSVLIYLSDHGQDVFDVERRFGHTLNQNCGFEIPFFLWMSPSFVKWRGEEVEFWKKCTARPAMSDCLGFFIADILDIQVASTNRKLSPLSQDWTPQVRVASGYVYDR